MKNAILSPLIFTLLSFAANALTLECSGSASANVDERNDMPPQTTLVVKAIQDNGADISVTPVKEIGKINKFFVGPFKETQSFEVEFAANTGHAVTMRHRPTLERPTIKMPHSLQLTAIDTEIESRADSHGNVSANGVSVALTSKGRSVFLNCRLSNEG